MTDRSGLKLGGKVAIVTGGSGGIGAATARMLAHEGATLVVGYRSGEERARQLIRELPSSGHTCAYISLNDSDSIRKLVDHTGQTHGRADILVNAAGFTKAVPHADLDALDDELFDQVLTSNVRGPFSIIRALAPLLAGSDDGVIVNVSSIAAFTGSGSSIAYCASKAALETMTLSLARALGPRIRVLCVSPGAVATDFLPGRDRTALEKLAQATPLKRVVEPTDVASAILACVTHLRATTGARIVVDGGRFLV